MVSCKFSQECGSAVGKEVGLKYHVFFPLNKYLLNSDVDDQQTTLFRAVTRFLIKEVKVPGL